MAFDAHVNFAYATVATAPAPAASGTSLTLSAGAGAGMPAVPFNATVWPAGTLALSSNAEIVRVTARAGDVLTLTRAQEATTARAIVVGDQFAATITAKTLQDVEGPVEDARLSSNVALENITNIFTQLQAIAMARGDLQFQTPGNTAKSHLQEALPSNICLTTNLYYDGANWMRDDVTRAATLLTISDGAFGLYHAAAGANPAVLVPSLTIDQAAQAAFTGHVLILNAARLQFGGADATHASLRGGLQVVPGSGAPTVEVVAADNSGWAGVRALCFISVGVNNNLADLTCGPTNFTAGVNISAGHLNVLAGDLKGVGAYLMEGPVYPGRIDVTGAARAQGSWYLASHASWGLYTNTGFYAVGILSGSQLNLAGAAVAASAGGIQCTHVEAAPYHVRAGTGLYAGTDVYVALGIYEQGRSQHAGWWTEFTATFNAEVGTATNVANYQCRYSIVGKTLHINFYVWIDLTATPAWIGLTWSGVPAAAAGYGGSVFAFSGAAVGVGIAETGDGAGYCLLYRDPSHTTGWPAGRYYLRGTLTFPIQ